MTARTTEARCAFEPPRAAEAGGADAPIPQRSAPCGAREPSLHQVIRSRASAATASGCVAIQATLDRSGTRPRRDRRGLCRALIWINEYIYNIIQKRTGDTRAQRCQAEIMRDYE